MKQKVQIGSRKIKKIQKAHCVNLSNIWMVNNHAKQGDCVVRLEKDGSLNISFTQVQTAKPELSRNIMVNEGGKVTSGNRSPIIKARNNGKITTGDNSHIIKENILSFLRYNLSKVILRIIS